MRKLPGVLALKWDLRCIEILSRKRVINDFSMWRYFKCFLSFSHNVAFLFYDIAYLLAYHVMLVTSTSFVNPNARWRCCRKPFDRYFTYRQNILSTIMIKLKFPYNHYFLNFLRKQMNITKYTIVALLFFLIK